jgi:hypothetical protein
MQASAQKAEHIIRREACPASPSGYGLVFPQMQHITPYAVQFTYRYDIVGVMDVTGKERADLAFSFMQTKEKMPIPKIISTIPITIAFLALYFIFNSSYIKPL